MDILTLHQKETSKMNEATRKVMHSSKNQDWQTPIEELRKWEQRFGFYTYLDPCTSEDNPLVAPRIYTEDDDGLEQSWDISEASPRIQKTFEWVGDGEKKRMVTPTGERVVCPAVFANPGYGRGLKAWVRKAYWEHRKHGSMIVMLLPYRAPSWFHDYVLTYLRTVDEPLKHYVPLRKRIKFVGAKDPAPFDSVLWIQKQVEDDE